MANSVTETNNACLALALLVSLLIAMMVIYALVMHVITNDNNAFMFLRITVHLVKTTIFVLPRLLVTITETVLQLLLFLVKLQILVFSQEIAILLREHVNIYNLITILRVIHGGLNALKRHVASMDNALLQTRFFVQTEKNVRENPISIVVNFPVAVLEAIPTVIHVTISQNAQW
jgi:hypothetical protein